MLIHNITAIRRLTKRLTNPNADGRKSHWQSVSGWDEGRVFVIWEIVHSFERDESEVVVRHTAATLVRFHDYAGHGVGKPYPRTDGIDPALLTDDNSEVVAATDLTLTQVEAVSHQLCEDPYGLIHRLLECGAVSPMTLFLLASAPEDVSEAAFPSDE